jgi:hypothetical protein
VMLPLAINCSTDTGTLGTQAAGSSATSLISPSISRSIEWELRKSRGSNGIKVSWS